jgi:hypothetical protein
VLFDLFPQLFQQGRGIILLRVLAVFAGKLPVGAIAALWSYRDALSLTGSSYDFELYMIQIIQTMFNISTKTMVGYTIMDSFEFKFFHALYAGLSLGLVENQGLAAMEL